MNNCQAVLFDLDGTLLDSAPDLINCLHLTLNKKNLTVPTHINFRALISQGARAMLAAALDTQPSSALVDEFIEDFLCIYDANSFNKSKLFDGVERLLATLQDKQIPWGIVTNKSNRFADKIVSQHELLSKAVVCICPEDVADKKPNPEGILLACKQMQVNPQNCWYVGDHQKDLEAGYAANCQLAFATYGYVESDWQQMELLPKVCLQQADEFIAYL